MQPLNVTQPGRITVTGTAIGHPSVIILRVKRPSGTVVDITSATTSYASGTNTTTFTLTVSLPTAGQWEVQWIVDDVGSRIVGFNVAPGLPTP